jgi:SAM-dependent methyltransferase
MIGGTSNPSHRKDDATMPASARSPESAAGRKMVADERRAHWERIYSTRGEQEVSWFEDSPSLSIQLIRESGVGTDATIIDVGGGASRLIDSLVGDGQAHVTVLDLSASALEVSKARLGDHAAASWVVSDAATWSPDHAYDLWHDRAAFHFLTDVEDQRRYVAVLKQALAVGGIAIIGTFATDGPEKCSGLPVARYDAEGLQAVLGADFELVAQHRHEHITPWGSVQRFQFGTFRRIN